MTGIHDQHVIADRTGSHLKIHHPMMIWQPLILEVMQPGC